MPRITFDVESEHAPDEILAMATDFSDTRTKIWPALDPAVYRRLAEGPTWAEVIEGGGPLPGMWARERYDWSDPDTVRAEILESSLFRPGGHLDLRVRAREAGSIVSVTWDRRPSSLRGLIVTALVVLFGRAALADQLRTAIEAYAARESGITPAEQPTT